ncbi:hypothetical protein V5O48_018112, partial [Marasmius crinis-equi]
RSGEFFTQLGDKFSTLTTVPIATAQWITEEKQQELSVLGAVVGLALIYGYSPFPLNPLLLIYLINNQDLASLRPTIVNHWAPDLYVTLKRWTSIHSFDSIDEFAGHFATYHDLQISVIRSRSPEMHKVLGWEMLHSAVVGPQPGVQHPFWVHFLRGFNMPCKKGFSLPQIARAYIAGSTEFVGSIYDGHISNYNSLRLEFNNELTAVSQARLDIALSSQPGLPNFKALFRGFLEGTGAPCPDLLASIKDRFSPSIDLNDINSFTFRMRMFCWATTGTPNVILDGPKIEVILVDDDDAVYVKGFPKVTLKRT